MSELDADQMILRDLKEKYVSDEYMSSKLNKYIQNLPTLMNNIYEERQKNKMSIQLMANLQEQFINRYLEQNPYYYCQTTNTFFSYINNKYHVCTDEDILHHVWKTMPHNEILYDWQSSTRRYIVKRIRDKGMTNIVPESETIQNVLNDLYSVFQNRDATKYFLTILGDYLIKSKRNEASTSNSNSTSSNITVLVPIELKRILSEIEKIGYRYFGTNCTIPFKYRHFAHIFQNCRLLQITPPPNTNNIDCWLDILFVAIYYSERYEGSEHFLNFHMNDTDLYRHIVYLINKTPSEIVFSFSNKYILRAEDSCIKWKDMQYLWSHFLNQNKLPSIVFLDDLRTIFMSRFHYDEKTDSFQNITSNYLPELERFLSFWKETVNQTIMNPSESDEYEISELCQLYTMWIEMINPVAKHREKHMTEKKMCDLIHFYFPLLTIKENRNISGITCNLWRKKKETLEISREILKGETNLPVITPEITVSELYKHYCKMKKKLQSIQQSHRQQILF